jgi:hypothetical protein
MMALLGWSCGGGDNRPTSIRVSSERGSLPDHASPSLRS